MFKNHLKIAWRNLSKRKVFACINILGLALGFGCTVLIFLYVNHHLQFNTFHNNADRIYRIVTEEHRDDIEYDAAVPPGFAKAFRTDYEYSEKVASLYTRGNWQINGTDDNATKRFKEDIAFAEPDFFEILNFPLLEKLGNQTLAEPNTAYITESFAKKMFGNQSVLGQTFILDNRETISIIGVLEDIPEQTVIEANIFSVICNLKKL